jgi:hypothetical protein
VKWRIRLEKKVTQHKGRQGDKNHARKDNYER